MMRLVFAVFVLIACNGASPEATSRDYGLARSLVGAWDASLSLTRPYPLEIHPPAAQRICGTIGFVENHRRDERSDSVGDLGVYDLDLSRLGLNWLEDGSYPAAIATASATPRASSRQLPHDSVEIVLNPRSSERIVLLGRHDMSGITGDWMAQSARGTATGLFSLRPHSSAPDRHPAC